MFELCASILAANFACLKREVRAAESAGGDVSYIDIMDGHFVSAISFGTGIVRTMGRLTQKPLDVHLMVENPLPFIPELAEEKVERVSVHYEIPGGPEKSPAGHQGSRYAGWTGPGPENPERGGETVSARVGSDPADDGMPGPGRPDVSGGQQSEDCGPSLSSGPCRQSGCDSD